MECRLPFILLYFYRLFDDLPSRSYCKRVDKSHLIAVCGIIVFQFERHLNGAIVYIKKVRNDKVNGWNR